MASPIDDLKLAFRNGTALIQIIFLNVGVFLALTLVRIFGFFFQSKPIPQVMPWISGHSNWEVMLYKPWTALTYMFVHEGLWHILFNMILLYFAGRMFVDLLNSKRFIAVYILGGLAGFLLYFIGYNTLPVFRGPDSLILGASASVMAVLVAVATYMPNMEVRLILIGNVKLKYVAIAFVALDILFLDGGNTGGRLAHIGGAAFGYFYALQLQKGNDLGKVVYGVGDFFRNLIVPKPKLKVASRNKAAQSAKPRLPDQQNKIDRILDKISRSGYDSLSKDEKEILFNASKK